MDLLDEIFDLCKFTSQQKKEAINDIDVLIKAKVSNDLIARLPNELNLKIKSISAVASPEVEEKIATIIKQYFSVEKIKEEQKTAIGTVVLSYFDFMLADASNENKEKAMAILRKYGVKV